MSLLFGLLPLLLSLAGQYSLHHREQVHGVFRIFTPSTSGFSVINYGQHRGEQVRAAVARVALLLRLLRGGAQLSAADAETPAAAVFWT